MYKLNRSSLKEVGLVGTIFGTLLVGFSAITQSAIAQPRISQINPCPRIFYEEPHRNRVMVPAGCPPNAATLRFGGQQQTTGSQSIMVPAYPMNGRRTNVIQPPAPENRQSAMSNDKPLRVYANITPTAGTVNVKLKNNTNAGISYQAIGHTQPRYLAGGQEFVLRDLPTPISITLVRQDGGLLKVMPMSTSEGEGTLAVSLDETTNFDNNQGVLRIQKDGQVFLN